jgi:hypothetical protein
MERELRPMPLRIRVRMKSFFKAKGLTHASLGQRPRNASSPPYFKALNGRNKTTRLATICIALSGLLID